MKTMRMNFARPPGTRSPGARAARAAGLSLAVCLFLGSAAQAQPAAPSLFRVVERGNLDQGRSLRIQIDQAALAAQPERIQLELPSGPAIAHRTASSDTAVGVFWRGRLQGEQGHPALAGGSDVLLTLHQGLLIGRIYAAESAYAIAPNGSSASSHLLYPIENLAAFRRQGSAVGASEPLPCGGAVAVERPFGIDAASRTDVEQVNGAMGTPRLDVMIAFTSRARGELGGNRIEAEARSAVDFFNTSLANSGVSGSARLVQTVVAPQFDGFRSHGAALTALRLDATIAQQRDAANADVVVLLLASADSSEACGLGYVLQRGDTPASMAPFGFSTVNVSCDIGSTTTHEIGHNIGLQHDPQNAGGGRIYAPDAHGHFFGQGANFKTIMAYGPFGEIPFFSTPDIEFRDRPIGIRDERNNVRVLGETLRMGSRYRDGNAGPQDGDPTIAPTELTATNVGATQLRLAWVDNASEEIVVLVEQRPSGGTWLQAAELPPDTTEYLVTGLQRSTSYDFRVRVRTGDDVSTYSNRVRVMTLAGLDRPRLLDAVPISSTSIRLEFTGIEVGDTVQVQQRSLDSLPGAYQVVAEVPEDGNGTLLLTGLTPGQPYSFRLLAVSSSGQSSEPSELRSATAMETSGACIADAETLCLQSGRFEVRAHWNDPHNPPMSGSARVATVPGSDETGLLYFFDAANIELVSKVLDGRAINQRFWSFYGALSDVEYWLTVRDTETGTTETYHNEPFGLCGAADIETFDGAVPARRAGAGSSTSVSGARALPLAAHSGIDSLGGAIGTCVEDGSRLCLGDARFSVTVDWEAPDGAVGIGRPVAGTATRDSGFLWFFNPANLELAVKILDGRPINDKFWFYWGGLSDVAYTITVLDTVTGNSATYSNAAGDLCGGADVNALDG